LYLCVHACVCVSDGYVYALCYAKKHLLGWKWDSSDKIKCFIALAVSQSVDNSTKWNICGNLLKPFWLHWSILFTSPVISIHHKRYFVADFWSILCEEGKSFFTIPNSIMSCYPYSLVILIHWSVWQHTTLLVWVWVHTNLLSFRN